MSTPIHGEVDPTVKKQHCLSKHYAHTTKRASMRNQKTHLFFVRPETPIVLAGFMQQPTSDAHSSTYLISAKFDGIAYTCVYIYTQYILRSTLSIYTCLVIWRLPRHQWHLCFFTNGFLQTKYDATNISSMQHVGAWKSEHGKSPRLLTIAYYCQKSLQRLVNGDLEQDVIS